ncbi:GHKL domain-containing protein [Pseudobacillus wudalianchiensis]|uniref:Histidine kinase n=1 Tax=Pseudobacillus wudalianchiensis TaxID=1743143 RepID=A0A1B9B7N7_9BACI|nr:GHKL domain-containing protein [Bacillus wudalianchiensis]OCA92083.1 histidine kinase [Bacillus wudalianchiensis]
MKRNKIKLIFILSIMLLLFFTSLNMYTSYLKIKRTVEESIANQSVEAAKSIASSIDIETYEQFLLNPVKNEPYWELRSYLNDAREKIGALYVYTLAIDNPKAAKTMIVGMPEEAKRSFPIGEVCTVPEKQVKRAYEGKAYVTGVIKDDKYGDYLSVGAPIKGRDGKIIGYLGIDIGADMLEDIGGKVIENSISILVFNGVFVFIVLLSFFIMNKWYQKESVKEIEETEGTYQTEIRTLISSVQSLRHDFINHVQVLHGLLKLEKQAQALDYAASLFKEVQAIESIKLNVDNPGLSVLLQTKKLSAQNYNIDIQFTISSDPFDMIKTTDLIKILSNLIDNAIDATIELPEDERKIDIVCRADVNQYVFKITNTGSKIKDKENIFKSGFSTKEAVPGKVRGQGLFIVKEVVNKYNGRISIDSTGLETVAIVEIPK